MTIKECSEIKEVSYEEWDELETEVKNLRKVCSLLYSFLRQILDDDARSSLERQIRNIE